MKKTFRKISLLVVLAVVVSTFANVSYAQAASVWSFISGSGKKIEVNDTITLQKNEYQDLNIYKSGKEIKTNDSAYKITWKSSNPDVVWINASTGKLRADRLKKMTADTGTVKIIATIKNLKTGAVAKRGFTINVIKEKVKGYLDLTSAGWSSYNAGLNENMTGGTAGKLYPGAKLEIINEKTNANGVLVCRVYAPDLGRECYVNKKYIKLESEKVAPTATPTVAPTATPTPLPVVTKVYGTLDLSSAGWKSYSVGINSDFTGGTYGQIYQGAKLEILEECTNAKGTLVYKVYSGDLNKECYVTAKYVKVDSSAVPPQTEPVVTPIVIPEVKPEDNKKYGTLDISNAGWKSYSVGVNANFTGGTYGQIYQGAVLEILEECTNAKGTLVYKVYSADLGKECYVTAKYVTISTDNTVNNQEQTPDGVYGATINMFNTLLNSLNETKEVFSQSNYWIYDDYHKIHLPNLITDTGLIQQKFESIYNQTFDEKDISYSLYSMRLLRETLEKDIYLLKEYRDSLSVKLLGGDTLKKSIDEVVSWFEWNSQDQINQLIEAIKKEAKEARRVKIVEVAYQEFENNKTNPFSKRQDVKYNYNRPSADDGSKPAAWCASFVNWCAYAAGIPESIIPHETQESAYISKNGKDYSLAYVPHLVEYMQKYCGAVLYTIDSEAMTSGTYVPRAGDLIIYMSGSGGMRHIGLVVDFDEVSKRVITIEGNTTDTETKATGYIETKNRAYMNQNVAPSQDFYLLGYLAPNY